MSSIVFKFWGDRWGHHPESPGFQNLMNFLEGGCIFSQLYHLSRCHPNWVACALYMLSSAGFIFYDNQLC